MMAPQDDGTDDSELLAESGGGGGRHSDNASVCAPDDEPVGYKRPPRKNQFKPGESGNPKGRPKGDLNLRTIVQSELAQKLTIGEGEKRMTVSKLQLLVKRMIEKALKGEQRAIEHLINLNVTMFGLGEGAPAERQELTPGEEAFLNAVMRERETGDAAAGHHADLSLLNDGTGEDDDGD